MKNKLYSVVACLGAMSLAACVTSVSDDGGGGIGNSGGSGNTGNTGNSGNAGGSDGGGDTGGGAVGGAGGSGGAGACVFCAEALSDAESPFCDTEAEELFDSLSDCICNTGCATECGTNLCDGSAETTQDCIDCFTGIACQQEFTDCSNDVN